MSVCVHALRILCVCVRVGGGCDRMGGWGRG